VYLVRVMDTVYVLGASDHAFEKLGEMPSGSLPQAPLIEEQSFAAVLKRAVGMGGAKAKSRPPESPQDRS
jgi:hypothetical protein